ncbi:Ribose 5-phosphate isomerase A [hydrothermal vent metagenome]|uniref:ribose-5-phosphate isomerase n=1 Tax=hydrothermal vent metagenome TaxID=652676 RepID=A0A3B0TXY0_9ZZZZ
MDHLKRQAAQAAMVELDIAASKLKASEILQIGLGTGSTARHFVDLLGEKVASGFKCICVPTSNETAAQAKTLNIALTDLDTIDRLHITIDGTDEIAPDMSLIKGGGGALLREKIVAAASDKMVVIADEGKRVEHLGAFALPVEVNVFGLKATKTAIGAVMKKFDIEPEMSLRMAQNGEPFMTDGAHFVIDACFGRILDARGTSSALLEVPGVVQHGLFLEICQTAYLAGPQGVSKLMA